MRTTVTLADDVSAAVDKLRRERGQGVSEIVNDLVRKGLSDRPGARRFTQATSDMGAPALPLDDVAGLLESLDGPAAR